MIVGRHLQHFNVLAAPIPETVAPGHNSLKRLAERTPLGIPVTLSSDPRNAAGFNTAVRISPQGSLAVKARDLARILPRCRAVPTVVDLRLDRPAVIPEIAREAAAGFVSFGCQEAVLLDAVFGICPPTASLPLDLPSSMAAVEASRTDVPRDTEDPLFGLGWGLAYPSKEPAA